MGPFTKGDIVLFPFPYTDLSSRKLRPCLVLSNEMGEDILLCQITSRNIAPDRFSIEIRKDETLGGGLQLDSLVRANMLFTAEKNQILKKICSISGTELIEQGYLVAPKIMFRDIPKLAKVQKNWQAVKSKYIIDNVERNQILVKNALRLVEMGRKPLMLFRDLKHGENLRSLLAEHTRAELVSGASSDDARLGLKQKFLDGQIDVIVSSSILDQGFDLPKLDALVLCSGGKSTAKALQRVGRVLRTSPGKTDAIVVDTYDQSHYVGAHAYERYKIYKTEPAFMVKTEAAMAEFIRKQEWSEL